MTFFITYNTGIAFFDLLTYGVRKIFAALLPTTNDVVAATAPTNENILIESSITITITANSIAVPQVIGAVFLSLTRTDLWKLMNTVKAGIIAIIFKGVLANSLRNLDNPDTSLNQISANGVKAIIKRMIESTPASIIAKFLNGT